MITTIINNDIDNDDHNSSDKNDDNSVNNANNETISTEGILCDNNNNHFQKSAMKL